MEQVSTETGGKTPEGGADIHGVIREAIEEYSRREAAKAEPAYKNELIEERKRREQLERRVNELVQENARSRQLAEEAERNSTIRAELQRRSAPSRTK
jgi:molybdenum-dependent DNA-binding transcriptional regulator ModE